MSRTVFSIFFLIFQLLISNTLCEDLPTDENECDFEEADEEVIRLPRSVVLDQLVLSEDCKRNIIDRLLSYFRWPSSYTREVQAPVLAEGIGEIFVHGDNIFTDGITEVEGTVPISGSVVFSGPVRASGTVTIAGRCAPASGASPLRIGQPLLLRPTIPPPSPPVQISPIPEILPSLDCIPIPTVEILPTYPPIIENLLPTIDILPTYTPKIENILPTLEVLPLPNPTPIPTITLPPVVIPAIVIPSYVLPEVVLPAPELATGTGSVVVSGNDVAVDGTTYIEGSVPTMGEVTFSGYVPAKGSVTIYSCL